MHGNKNASALNKDRTQQVEQENTANQVGEDPSSKFLTAIVITFVQLEVSHLLLMREEAGLSLSRRQAIAFPLGFVLMIKASEKCL